MDREQDRELAARCEDMADAAREALVWTANNPDLLGPRRNNVDRTLKKQAVQARKLANAARRPMSVAVFGASQAGKSFLIGKMITPPDPSKEAKVVFGTSDRLDFLEEVNPVGGKETTGLVTRFSVTAEPAPAGFPVQLRLLREVDLVKILANTYAFDLGAPEFEGDALDALSALGSSRAAQPQPGFSDEDMFELQDYVNESLRRRHPLAERDGAQNAYWGQAETLVPALTGVHRMKALEPIWGGVSELSDLYLQLKQALDQLGHPITVFTNLDAIRDRSNGILHVQTLHGLDQTKLDKMDQAERAAKTGSVNLATLAGAQVSLPKPVVTALTAELRVTLERAPWPFFEHTDLLDFPGARSREDSTVEAYLRKGADDDQKGRTNAFLRGKVAVLFDTYVADLDLNSMVLCVDDSNQEVKMLPELVDGWIAMTHGRDAQDRVKSSTAMFLTLTKCDRLFERPKGAGNPDQRITNRLDNNIGFYSNWTSNWLPNKPFNNVYLLRNPSHPAPALFNYSDPPAGAPEDAIGEEVGLRSEFEERIPSLREAFLNNDRVKRHVSQPEEKFNGLLAMNDGGVTILANDLAPVCDPELKYRQIRERAAEVAKVLRGELTPFHESGDLEARIRDRKEKVDGVIQKLTSHDHLIGPFIRELCVNPEAIAMRYREHRASSADSNKVGAQQNGGRMAALMRGAGSNSNAETAAHAGFAHHAVSVWLGSLDEKAGDDLFVEGFSLTGEQMKQLISELSALASRVGLTKTLADAVRTIESFSQRADEAAPIIGERVALIINALVRDLEFQSDAGARRETSFPQFPELPEEGPALDQFRFGYFLNWCDGLRATATTNASQGSGGLVDAEQNAILGALIQRLRVG